MQQEIQKQRVIAPVRRRLRKTLLPYASYAALTGLQIIFVFSFLHYSPSIRLVLFFYAVLVGVGGSIPLLRALTSRKQEHTLSLAMFQRSLPSLLLLAWGESHLLDCSYIPFNRLAITVWLVYVAIGLFFGVVRLAHRARLRREMSQATERTDLRYTSASNASNSTGLAAQDSTFLASHNSLLSRTPAVTAPEQEAAVAGRL